MDLQQLTDDEMADIESITRAKVAHLLLSMEWVADIGDSVDDAPTKDHIGVVINKICNEILGDMTLSEYVSKVSTN